MEKIRIKATGEIYNYGDKDGIISAACSTLTGYMSLSDNYEEAEKIVQEFHDNGDNTNIFEDHLWVTPYSFNEKIHDEELLEEYGGWYLFTEFDGCFYCIDDDTLYENSMYALDYFDGDEDNHFYFHCSTGKFYTSKEVELFEE